MGCEGEGSITGSSDSIQCRVIPGRPLVSFNMLQGGALKFSLKSQSLDEILFFW